jgi:tripeptidyl-peptidase-1
MELVVSILDQLNSYIAPTSETLSAFNAFAEANGLSFSSLSSTNEWIEITTSVAQANTIFGASYQHYKHTATGATLTRTLVYLLPQELFGHVDTITPATGFEIDVRFGANFKPTKLATTPVTCNTLASNSSITPKCLQVNPSYYLFLMVVLKLCRACTAFLQHLQSHKTHHC